MVEKEGGRDDDQGNHRLIDTPPASTIWYGNAGAGHRARITPMANLLGLGTTDGRGTPEDHTCATRRLRDRDVRAMVHIAT